MIYQKQSAMNTSNYTTTCTSFKSGNTLEHGNCMATYGKYEKELLAGVTYKLTDTQFNGRYDLTGKFVGVFFEKVGYGEGETILPLLVFSTAKGLMHIDPDFFKPKYYIIERIA